MWWWTPFLVVFVVSQSQTTTVQFLCDVCTLWQHCSCIALTTTEYSSLQVEGPDSSWSCPACHVSKFPSNDCSKLSGVSGFESTCLSKPQLQQQQNSSPESGKCFSIFYTNCRSILPKLEELRVLASSKKPNFIALTETWLDGSISSQEVHIDSYSIFLRDHSRHSGAVLTT